MRVSYWSQDRDGERSREAGDLLPNLRGARIRGKEKCDATHGVVKSLFQPNVAQSCCCGWRRPRGRIGGAQTTERAEHGDEGNLPLSGFVSTRDLLSLLWDMAGTPGVSAVVSQPGGFIL